MAALRYYVVTQEQEVTVSATNVTDAAVLARRVFSGTMRPADQINVQERPKETSLIVREV